MIRSEDGFTIPELIIMMVVTSILTISVIGFSMSYWGSTAQLQNDSSTLVTRLNAGDALRDSLNVASGLISENSIPDGHAGSTDPIDGPSYWLTIHAIPQSIAMPAANVITPVFYFEAPSVTSTKNFIMNGTQAYQDEFVLYLDGSTKSLKLRTLTNPSASGNRLKTSCPAASATATCPADRVLADTVSSVDTRYLSRSGNTINYTSQVQLDGSGNPVVPTVYIGPDFQAVEVVELTVHLYQKKTAAAGANTSNQVIVRVALRNG